MIITIKYYTETCILDDSELMGTIPYEKQKKKLAIVVKIR